MNSKILLIAHETLFELGMEGYELHHWHGRASGKMIGNVNDMLITGVLPVTREYHDKDLRGETAIEDIMHNEFYKRNAHKILVAAMRQAHYLKHRGQK